MKPAQPCCKDDRKAREICRLRKEGSKIKRGLVIGCLAVLAAIAYRYSRDQGEIWKTLWPYLITVAFGIWTTLGFVRWKQRCITLLSRAEPIRMRFMIKRAGFSSEKRLEFIGDPAVLIESLKTSGAGAAATAVHPPPPELDDSIIESDVYFDLDTNEPVAYDCGPSVIFYYRMKDYRKHIFYPPWMPLNDSDPTSRPNRTG